MTHREMRSLMVPLSMQAEKFMMMPTEIVANGRWWELREKEQPSSWRRVGRLLAFSTSRGVIQRIQRDLKLQGYTEIEAA